MKNKSKTSGWQPLYYRFPYRMRSVKFQYSCEVFLWMLYYRKHNTRGLNKTILATTIKFDFALQSAVNSRTTNSGPPTVLSWTTASLRLLYTRITVLCFCEVYVLNSIALFNREGTIIYFLVLRDAKQNWIIIRRRLSEYFY